VRLSAEIESLCFSARFNLRRSSQHENLDILFTGKLRSNLRYLSQNMGFDISFNENLTILDVILCITNEILLKLSMCIKLHNKNKRF